MKYEYHPTFINELSVHQCDMFVDVYYCSIKGSLMSMWLLHGPAVTIWFTTEVYHTPSVCYSITYVDC